MNSTRIIVADPCRDTRDTLADLLRLYGFAADPVADPAALTERLRLGTVDVVITETSCDLDDTCRAVRSANPAAEVAVYTAWTRPVDQGRSESLGCRHFVKPDGVSELVKWLADRPAGDPARGHPDGQSSGRANAIPGMPDSLPGQCLLVAC